MKVGPPIMIEQPMGAPLAYRNPFAYRTWNYTYAGLAAAQSGTIAIGEQQRTGLAQKLPAGLQIGLRLPEAWPPRPPGTKAKVLGPGPTGAVSGVRSGGSEQ